MMPLSTFWIMISLFSNKEFKACNSTSLKFCKLLLGLSILNVSNEENAV